MKPLRLAFLPLFAGLLFCGCERSSHTYSDLKAAGEDIRNSWIPAILPPSSRNIQDTHDLATITGQGSFSFDPREEKSLFAKGARVSRPSSNPLQQQLKDQGFRFVSYDDAGSMWSIALNSEGKGYYFLNDCLMYDYAP